jgi:nucleobase:cation symporter-1, NCS1 family
MLYLKRPSAGRQVPLAATRIYEMSFFTGFGVSGLVYIVLNLLSPVPGKFAQFREVDVSETAGDKDSVDEIDMSGDHAKDKFDQKA